MLDEFAFINAGSEADWRRWSRRNVDVSDDGVTLASRATLTADPLSIDALDFDVVPNGNLAVLSPTGGIEIYVTDSNALKPLSVMGYDGDTFGTPSHVGAMRDGIFVLDSEAGRVGQISHRRRRLEWTTDLSADPVAVVGSRKRVYVLDAGDEDRPGALHSLTPQDRVQTVYEGFQEPVDLSVAPDETIWVLDERDGERTLVRVGSDVGLFHAEETTAEVTLPEGFVPESVSAQTTGTLLFAGVGPDDRPLIVEHDREDGSTREYAPPAETELSLVSGTVGESGDENRVYMGDPSREGVAVTKEYVNRKDPDNTRYEGRLTRRFDAGQRGEQWHRATFDIDQGGPDTRIDVSYYTTEGDVDGVDDFSRLPTTEFQDQELRGAGIHGLWDLLQHSPSEIQGVLPGTPSERIETWFDQAQTLVEDEFQRRDDVNSVHDPTDMLTKEATGRYLHVEVRLVGQRDASPRLRSVTTYCPRRSYIRYLPEIYREMSDRTSFLSHFLSIFESVFLDVEGGIKQRRNYFDPEEIPIDYLDWLNEWLAVEMGDGWPERARRDLLMRLPDLYRKRGTRDGVVELIDLYFENVELRERDWAPSLVRIERQLESLVDRGLLTSREAARQIERYWDRSEARDPSEIFVFEHDRLECMPETDRREFYENRIGHPRTFQVLLQPSVPQRHVQEVRSLVDANSPVYTDAEVKQLEQRCRLGGDTFLGVNSVLPTREFEAEGSTLGQETILEPNR